MQKSNRATHPALQASVTTRELNSIIKEWDSRSVYANSTNSDVWRSCISDLQAAVDSARERRVEARKWKARLDVEHRAVARELYQTAMNLYCAAAGLMDKANESKASGNMVDYGKESKAANKEKERAIRYEQALNSYLEFWGIHPDDL